MVALEGKCIGAKGRKFPKVSEMVKGGLVGGSRVALKTRKEREVTSLRPSERCLLV